MPEARPAPARAHRHAVYFAHRPNSAWWEAGCAWLGRDAASGAALPQPPVRGLAAAEQHALTAAPRRYGWHATLKAPFTLTAGAAPATLHERTRMLCGTLAPFALPPLKVALVDDDFLALVPEGDTAAIDRLARACVTGLHDLAAPLPPAELLRRRAAGLSPQEDALLLRWGYPFVLERFRFHLSLTGSLRHAGAGTIAALREAAERWFADLPPTRVNAVALFAEPAPGADFVLVEHIALDNA